MDLKEWWKTRFSDKVVGIQTVVNQCRLVSRKTRDKINFWNGREINFWTCDKINLWIGRKRVKSASQALDCYSALFMSQSFQSLVSIKTKKPEHQAAWIKVRASLCFRRGLSPNYWQPKNLTGSIFGQFLFYCRKSPLSSEATE